MSFSHRMKTEITENKPLRTRWKEPHAYGLFLFARSLAPGEFSLHTESGEVAGQAAWLLKSLLGRGTEVDLRERSSRGKPLYQVALPEPEKREALWRRFGFGGGLRRELLASPEEEAAFLAGAFLACGNITDPQKSYHMEFVVRHPHLAEALCQVLERHIPGPKVTERRGGRVVYYKECGQIEDLMTLMGASRSCLEMIDVEMIKSVRNRANRATNCETANIDKLVSAASAQVEDIRYLLEEIGENALPDNLREIARLRLENPDLSLRELAELSPTPISRSGVHHRLEKLSRMAGERRQREEKRNG